METMAANHVFCHVAVGLAFDRCSADFLGIILIATPWACASVSGFTFWNLGRPLCLTWGSDKTTGDYAAK